MSLSIKIVGVNDTFIVPYRLRANFFDIHWWTVRSHKSTEFWDRLTIRLWRRILCCGWKIHIIWINGLITKFFSLSVVWYTTINSALTFCAFTLALCFVNVFTRSPFLHHKRRFLVATLRAKIRELLLILVVVVVMLTHNYELLFVVVEIKLLHCNLI
jgi:hypothetical protein